MYAVSGILFNHESPRRGAEFVTRKVTLGVARIKLGLAADLRLGNLEARRDWGFAGDYVRAMHLMLQAGDARGLRDRHRADEVGQGAGAGRVRGGRSDWERYVVTDQALHRPAEVDLLCADPKKARVQLGWEPTVSFEELVAMMVESDLRLLSNGGDPDQDSSWP